MTGVIEALHIYDERNPIVSHTYTGRPLSAAHLISLYLSHASPRPNVLYLANASPPTLVFSLVHGSLLFLATASSEIEPLLVLEFLHRVADALEEFIGAPLHAHRIEANYDVVAQLLTEMCDAGNVGTTEPNALRDLVEVEGFMGKLLGGLNLGSASLGGSAAGAPPSLLAAQAPALPWRRANVRHTSNEMYADVVETLAVTLAPSGRPLAALASGTIAFTSKVSGVPDVLLTLSGPAGMGRHQLASLLELPAFHPCVRLARWHASPGELSFVPPDGRFVLAGYEVDLLPFAGGKSGSPAADVLKLPVALEIKTELGTAGADFEVRLNVNRLFAGAQAPARAAGGAGRGGLANLGVGGGGPQPGTLASPALENVVVEVPLPAAVRSLSEIRPTKGDVSYNPGDRCVEWRIPNKDVAAGTTYFGLRCTVVGAAALDDSAANDDDPTGFGFGAGAPYAYDEDAPQAKQSAYQGGGTARAGDDAAEDRDGAVRLRNKMLMPSAVSVSFAVRGWLPSGLRVESIVLDPRKSRGLGEAVKPYKGVKYLTVSKGGVEIRC